MQTVSTGRNGPDYRPTWMSVGYRGVLRPNGGEVSYSPSPSVAADNQVDVYVGARNKAAKLHLPCEIDDSTKEAISALGEVAYIVAPGSYHYFHIPSAQAAFPDAETYICPGIERKRPELNFDWFLGDRPPRRRRYRSPPPLVTQRILARTHLSPH